MDGEKKGWGGGLRERAKQPRKRRYVVKECLQLDKPHQALEQRHVITA